MIKEGLGFLQYTGTGKHTHTHKHTHRQTHIQKVKGGVEYEQWYVVTLNKENFLILRKAQRGSFHWSQQKERHKHNISHSKTNTPPFHPQQDQPKILRRKVGMPKVGSERVTKTQQQTLLES